MARTPILELLKRIARYFLKTLVVIAIILLVSIVALNIYYLFTEASNERDWIIDCSRLPKITIDGELVHIVDLRNFSYNQTDITKFEWINETYNVSRLQQMWFVEQPFALWGASAHTFVTFGFDDGKYVSVSVEARFTKGEKYDIISGMLDQYELWYVWGTETDILARRTNWKQEAIYLYPVNNTPQQTRAIFLTLANYTHELETTPQFYNSITNTCTSNLARRIDQITPGVLGITIARYLPGFSEDHLYDLGLINTTLPLEQARNAAYINDKGLQSQNNMSEYSQNIRK